MQVGGFTSRMVQHLREVFAFEVEAFDDPALHAFVERVRIKAEEWDITEEPLVERLIELFACFQPIRRDPLPDWISRLVRDPNRSAERLVGELEDQLRFGARS